MASIIPLEKAELPSTCYVFKNSTICPVSKKAAEEVHKFSLAIPLYWINVIEQRPLSNWIAETYQVKHESPQLLEIKDGKVVKVWNHHQIKQTVVQTQNT